MRKWSRLANVKSIEGKLCYDFLHMLPLADGAGYKLLGAKMLPLADGAGYKLLGAKIRELHQIGMALFCFGDSCSAKEPLNRRRKTEGQRARLMPALFGERSI